MKTTVSQMEKKQKQLIDWLTTDNTRLNEGKESLLAAEAVSLVAL
jgi:hypothetical protein